MIVLCLFCSCEREQEEELNFNFGNYNSMKVEIGNIRLFTKDGEIFNKEIIDNYVISKGHDFLIEKDYPEPMENIQIEFLTENTVNFITSEKSEIRNVFYKENIIYFEQNEISKGIKNEFSNLDKFFQYSPLYYNEINNFFEPGVVTVEYKNCFYGIYSKNKIKIPMLSLSLSTTQKKSLSDTDYSDQYVLQPTYPYEKSNYFLNLYNDFNEDSIEQLLNNEYYSDTLTVQKLNYVLER